MPSLRRFVLFFLFLGYVLTALFTSAQVVVATLPIGSVAEPRPAINSVTNKTYVVNQCGNNPICQSVGTVAGTVTVVDGVTLSTATLTVGYSPIGAAINSVTNKIYVANQCGNEPTCNSPGTLTVIDGSTLSIQTIPIGYNPFGATVNETTNKIYVISCGSQPCQGGHGTLSIIDGNTFAAQNVVVGDSPVLIAVNPVTNKIYEANECTDQGCTQGTVTVVDGVTLATRTVNVGENPSSMAINTVTNKIYVTNSCSDCHGNGSVTIIDGESLSTQTVTVGITPFALAVNSVTNKIYVANYCGNDVTCDSNGTVTVIDGTSLSTQSVLVESGPIDVQVNPVTDQIYVANQFGSCRTCSGGTVTVINGLALSTTPVAVGDSPQAVGVNPSTNRIYVPNLNDNTLSVIDGIATLRYVPVTPCREVDTRTGNGGILAGNTSRNFALQGTCGIPATALVYALNVTVVPPGPLGFLTIWPAGLNRPTSSTLNSLDGRIKANAAIVQAGVSGQVSVFVNNPTNVVLDIDGYFVAAANPNALQFYPMSPCRVVDTRNGTGPLAGPGLMAGVTRDFPMLTSSCNIPHTAQAYSLNFTAVPPAPLGFITSWPSGQPRPSASILNDLTGTIVANAAIVPSATDGDISVYANNNTQLIIDIDGYFAPPDTGGLSFYLTEPCRVLDTRQGNGQFDGQLPVDVAGSVCAPPAAAQAYVLNATVVPPGPMGFLTLWANGETRPTASTLNALDGAITSNMAIVPTMDGLIDAYANNPTQLILDLTGYFAP